MGFQLSGLNEMRAKIDALKAEFTQQVEVAVEAEATRLLEIAKEKCPIETGELRDSGKVAMSRDGGRTTAEISFNTPYAAEVHENLEAHHAVGQSKFLESTMMENATESGKRIADHIKEVLK